VLGALVGALALVAAAAPNPCQDPALQLRCPDLIAAPPSDLSAVRTARGRVLLRMENRIVNVGLGPAELFGERSGPLRMDARQVIADATGRRRRYVTGARLAWTSVPSRGGSYWKFRDALRMELWSLAGDGRAVALVGLSPKLNYCLRDLRRVRPGPQVSRTPHFGACNQSYRKQSVTLGTSVGWADIYPASYPGNAIDVTGLRGCFVALHRVDPQDGIFELDESNNVGARVVRLPYRPGPQRCPRYVAA
jgi:hypothetical protein